MEAEGEGEKPKMAESETQTTLKEAEVTEHDSFLMTRNLLRLAIFDINRYMRSLFPEEYFNDESVSASDAKLLTPMDAESQRLFDRMEKGVYDALQRKYLKTLMFCICETEEDGQMIEKYAFSFTYSDSDVMMNIKPTPNKNHGGTFSSNQRRSSACKMVRTLVELMSNLDKMPDELQRTRLLVSEFMPNETLI